MVSEVKGSTASLVSEEWTIKNAEGEAVSLTVKKGKGKVDVEPADGSRIDFIFQGSDPERIIRIGHLLVHAGQQAVLRLADNQERMD